MIRFKLNPNIERENTEDGVLFLNYKSEKIFYLGDVERFLLDNIEEHSLEEIVNLAEETYEGEDIRKDIFTFFDQLVASEIITKESVSS